MLFLSDLNISIYEKHILVLSTNMTLSIKWLHQLNLIILLKNVSHYSLVKTQHCIHVTQVNHYKWFLQNRLSAKGNVSHLEWTK